MFYYAQINDNYEVINVYSLAQVSTNENYIEITEEQYISGELVGKFYNSLSNTFEIMTDSMGTTDNVQVDWTEMMLSTKLDNMQVEINSKADIDHIHNGYATVDHTHTGYVSSNDLQILEDVIDTKANATHIHSEYASVNHSHDDYATQTALDTLELEVDKKAEANHTHDEYASSTHTHTVLEIGAAPSSHNHNSDYADINHNHDENYSAIDHTHASYATVSSLNELSTTVSGKANISHSHDDTYYTETEIDTKLTAKSDVSHTHTGVYDPSGSAASALTSANAYTDSKIDALVGEGASITLDTIGEISSAIEDNQDAIDLLNSAIANKANAVDLNTHASDTELHITDVERSVWNAKSDFSGNYNDLTNKPNIPSINGLASEDYVDEKVGAVTVESIGALPNTTVIPTVPTNVSAFANDAGYLTKHQSLDGLATETYVNTQIDAIDIPNALSDLTADSTHRVVTDAEKAAWNAKSNFSGNYNDLTNKPSIPSISGLATETYVDEVVSTKANSSHTHSISNVSGLQSALDNKSDTTHNHNSSYDAKGSAESALSSAKEYTDTAIDTLSEVVADKANTTDLTSHTGNTTVHITSTERTNWNAAKTHANAAHAPANAEPNQNAFSNVVVNGTTISADSKTDTLTFVAGNNVTITPDATGDSITISSANTVYTHPTTAGNKHIPAGGSSGQILRWASDGTAVWGSDNNTTYSNATQSASGLMSNIDKTKLDGVAENANNYTLPSAGTNLGGVKSGGDVSISSGIITVNDDSHNHVISNIDGLQSALDGKASSGHNHDGVYYTEAETDTLLEGKADTSHTHTISNITNLQSTLDGKANASHGTHVSYSTTAPVMDGTASVGTASTVARSDHKHPTDTSRASKTEFDTLATTVSTKANTSDLNAHSSNKSNPHGVTLEQLEVTATASELNILDGVTATTAEINYVDGVTSNIQTQLNSKASSTHTHNAATTSAAGLMSADDKAKLDGIASGANKYILPTASSTLGGVKTTSTVTSNSGYTACPIIGGVPYYKDTNTTYSLDSFGVTATAAELNYVDGVTSNVQTQLNGKAASSHTHNYAGSSSAGGAATSANKLATARTISLAGDVSGSTSFDGSGNVSITATIADDSHNHIIANVDGLQSALDVKSDNDHRHYPIPIAVTGQDLNDYTDAGFYTFAAAYTPTNAPSGNTNGWLLVVPWVMGNATVKQFWFRHGSINNNDFETYVRTKIGSYGWSNWSKFYTTNNPPTAAEVGAISKSLQFTDNNGSFKMSYNKDDGKNILTEIAAYPIGFYTVYSQSGTDGNPKDTEAWRFMVHKTGTNTGWVQGYGSIGSVYTNYLDGSSGWRGWQCIYDTAPPILWMGEYWCTDTQTVTPSKALSKCRNGWVLVWSDYDTANEKATNGDCYTTVIPKWNPNHVKWSGQSFIATIPSGLNDSGVVTFAGKRLYVHDTKITGHTVNDVAPSNDVCLRAIYEY